MTPQMETLGPFTVLGVAHSIRRGSESPDLFADIWRTFEAHQQRIQPAATSKVYYGVTFPTPDANVTEYLAGMAVPAATTWPDGLEARPIPGGVYAVFECSVDAIGSTYQYVFSTWLPSATLHVDSGRPSFELYPENPAERPVRIYIPVLRKPAAGRGAG